MIHLDFNFFKKIFLLVENIDRKNSGNIRNLYQVSNYYWFVSLYKKEKKQQKKRCPPLCELN
jgi:negative regulator of genetic competence, sporulation and motility